MGWSGCKAVMVVSVLHSSRPISGPPFLHPPSLLLPSVLKISVVVAAMKRNSYFLGV